MRAINNETVIVASKRRSVDLKELWLYRELFFFFAWRDIKVRYKQTALGVGWAILQPFLTTAVFTIFFNKVAGISSGSANIPYAVFAYLGLMYWNCFSAGINTVGNSLVSNTGVITKIYFPRLIPPLSATALSVVDFFFASLIFVVLLFVYHITPGLWGLILFIPALLLLVFAALGIGIFFAALNVRYRDVRTALPFITQILLFVTPIIYPVTLIPEKFRIFTYLNPATGAISSVRAGFFHGAINWAGLGISIISSVVIMLVALAYFKKAEKGFADII